MKKDHDFDGEDSRVKSEEKKPQKMQVGSWSDLVVLLLIAAAAFGIYKYFSNAKKEANEIFARCNALYEAKSLAAAEDCYDSTWSLSYVTDTLEMIRQERLGLIGDERLLQMDLMEIIEESLAAGDSSVADSAIEILRSKEILLKGSDAKAWQEFAKLKIQKPDTTEQKQDSLAKAQPMTL